MHESLCHVMYVPVLYEPVIDVIPSPMARWSTRSTNTPFQRCPTGSALLCPSAADAVCGFSSSLTSTPLNTEKRGNKHIAARRSRTSLLATPSSMSTSSHGSDRPSTPKDRASTPSRPRASSKSKGSPKAGGGLIQAFGTLRIDNQDGAPSGTNITALMERDATEQPSPDSVEVSDAIREKAVATKKYLRKKYAERAKNHELAQNRRKAFEVCLLCRCRCGWCVFAVARSPQLSSSSASENACSLVAASNTLSRSSNPHSTARTRQHELDGGRKGGEAQDLRAT